MLMEPIQLSLGMFRSAVAGAYSLGLLVIGAAAIPVGLLIDRGQQFLVLVGGTLITFGGLILDAGVQPAWQLCAVWSLIGIGMELRCMNRFSNLCSAPIRTISGGASLL